MDFRGSTIVDCPSTLHSGADLIVSLSLYIKATAFRLPSTSANEEQKERVMFAIFLGLWRVFVLMALCVISWHSYGRAMVEAHWEMRRTTNELVYARAIWCAACAIDYIKSGATLVFAHYSDDDP